MASLTTESPATPGKETLREVEASFGSFGLKNIVQLFKGRLAVPNSEIAERMVDKERGDKSLERGGRAAVSTVAVTQNINSSLTNPDFGQWEADFAQTPGGLSSEINNSSLTNAEKAKLRSVAVLHPEAAENAVQGVDGVLITEEDGVEEALAQEFGKGFDAATTAKLGAIVKGLGKYGIRAEGEQSAGSILSSPAITSPSGYAAAQELKAEKAAQIAAAEMAWSQASKKE